MRLREEDWGGTSKQRLQTSPVQNQESQGSERCLRRGEIRVCLEVSQLQAVWAYMQPDQSHVTWAVCTTVSRRGGQGRDGHLASNLNLSFLICKVD